MKLKTKAATKKLAEKAVQLRTCLKCKAVPVQYPRSKRCRPCQLETRKLQLKRNNRTWMKRIAEGAAGHRLVYAGKPTEFALKAKSSTKKVKPPMAAKKAVEKKAPAKKEAPKGNPFAKGAKKEAPKGKAPPFGKKAKA